MYEITSVSDGKINYAATGDEAILQNAKFLLSTSVGTATMHREYGIDSSVVDEPSEIAKSMLTTEIIEKLERSIPELTVTEINISDSEQSGKLTAKVKVVINHGN